MSNRRLTDEQRDLVEAHPMVAILASKKAKGYIEEDDAIQEATLGVIYAAQRFDRRDGVVFPAYAYRRAVGSVKDAERNSGTIKCRDQSGNNAANVNQCRYVARFISSPNNDVPNRVGPATLGTDQIANDDESVFDQVCRREWHDRFWEAVAMLTPRSQAIVRGRVEGLSLKDSGEQIGLSGDRVFQLEREIAETIACLMLKSGAA